MSSGTCTIPRAEAARAREEDALPGPTDSIYDVRSGLCRVMPGGNCRYNGSSIDILAERVCVPARSHRDAVAGSTPGNERQPPNKVESARKPFEKGMSRVDLAGRPSGEADHSQLATIVGRKTRRFGAPRGSFFVATLLSLQCIQLLLLAGDRPL